MIDARTARSRSLLASKLKEEMKSIEKDINEAVDEGVFTCNHRVYGNYTKDEENAITEELDRLGYTYVYKRLANSQSCPLSQMEYYSDLMIRWDDRTSKHN